MRALADVAGGEPGKAGALEASPEPEALSATALLLAAFDGSASRPPARTLWPGLDVADLLMTPLVSGGERLGLLCAGAPPRRPFTGEDTEMARAIAHLAAIAIKRAELIEGLTNANIVKDLFEALAAGATTFAATKAGEVRCDLSRPYLMLCAEPAAGREQGSGEWRAAAEVLGRDLAELGPWTAIESWRSSWRGSTGVRRRRGGFRGRLRRRPWGPRRRRQAPPTIPSFRAASMPRGVIATLSAGHGCPAARPHGRRAQRGP